MENALTLIVILLLFVIIIMLFVIMIVWICSGPKPPNPGPKPSEYEVPEIHPSTPQSPRENLPVPLPEDPSITDKQALAILSYSINDIEESRTNGWV